MTDPAVQAGVRLADDVPEPQPADDELLLDVRAFSVNRGELDLIATRTDGWCPGQDVSGVVLRQAADGSGAPAGTRVVALTDEAGWAQRVAVPASRATALPDTVGYEDAATLPIAGLTALRALRVGPPLLGARVLVLGGSGGVGQFAVQLAVAAGARVATLASTPEKADLVRRLGATETLATVDGSGPFDLVLDGVGGPIIRDALAACAPGATVVTYGVAGGPGAEIGLPAFAAAPMTALVGFVFSAAGGGEAAIGADLASLVEFVRAKAVRPQLGRVSDWSAAPDVLRALGERQIAGKAVLTVPGTVRGQPTT